MSPANSSPINEEKLDASIQMVEDRNTQAVDRNVSTLVCGNLRNDTATIDELLYGNHGSPTEEEEKGETKEQVIEEKTIEPDTPDCVVCTLPTTRTTSCCNRLVCHECEAVLISELGLGFKKGRVKCPMCRSTLGGVGIAGHALWVSLNVRDIDGWTRALAQTGFGMEPSGIRSDRELVEDSYKITINRDLETNAERNFFKKIGIASFNMAKLLRNKPDRYKYWWSLRNTGWYCRRLVQDYEAGRRTFSNGQFIGEWVPDEPLPEVYGGAPRVRRNIADLDIPFVADPAPVIIAVRPIEQDVEEEQAAIDVVDVVENNQDEIIAAVDEIQALAAPEPIMSDLDRVLARLRGFPLPRNNHNNAVNQPPVVNVPNRVPAPVPPVNVQQVHQPQPAVVPVAPIAQDPPVVVPPGVYDPPVNGLSSRRMHANKDDKFFQKPIVSIDQFFGLAPGEFIAVNLWAIIHARSSRKYIFQVEGSMCHMDYPDLPVESDAYKVFATGRYPFYDGGLRVRAQTADGVMLVVSAHLAADRPELPSDHAFRVPEGLDPLVYTVATATIPRAYSEGAMFDTVKMVDMVTAQYKRYAQPYYSLGSAITKVVTSDTFIIACRDYVSRIATNWWPQAIDTLVFHAGRRGLARTEVESKLKRSLKWQMAKKVACITALSVLPVVGWGVGAYWAITDKWSNEASRRRQAVRSLSRELGLERNPVQVAPCSRIAIEAYVCERDKAATILDNPPRGFKCTYDSETINTCESKRPEKAKYGTHIPGVPQKIPQNTAVNVDHALGFRMLFPREIDEKMQEDFITYAEAMIEKIGALVISYSTLEDLQVHLISTYGTAKGMRLFNSRDEVLNTRHTKSKLFCKTEIYFKSEPKTRMIWNREELILAKFSLLFKKIGAALKKRLAVFGIMYSSKETPDSVGQFGRLIGDHPSIIECDVSSWDGSLSPAMLDLEKRFLQKMVERNENVDWLLDNWDNVNGATSDKSVRVKMNWGRRSGDLWTSCFNSLMNVLVTLWVYRLDLNDDFHLLVMGDDNLLGTSSEVGSGEAVERYASIGMKAEIVDREFIEDAEFCSGHFVPVDGVLRWGIKPFKQLAKLGTNYYNNPEHLLRNILMGTAIGMLGPGGHMPILGAVLRAIRRTARRDKLKARRDHRHLFADRIQGGVELRPAPDTYEWFSKRYGIDKGFLIEVDQWLEANIDINQCPYLLSDPFFTTGAMTDLGCEWDDNTNIHYELKESVPLSEEKEKLVPGDLSATLSNAWALGSWEDEQLGLSSHKWLHCAFSLVSYIRLDWGVTLHERYNNYAMTQGFAPCARKKAKQAKPRRKPLPPKKKTRSKQSSSMALTSKGIGMAVGRAIGGYFGGKPGSDLGGAAGAWLSKVSGMGEYKVRQNSLTSGPVPSFGNESIRVKHREYISDIYSSTTFNVDEYIISPTNVALFPWLSKIAQNFQQYKINGMIFEFVSTCGSAISSTNNALGTVVMATQYDVYRPSFVSKVQMENSQFAVSTKPSECLIHPLECDPRETPYAVHYVSIETVPDGDLRLYEFGRFSLATVGMQPALVDIGELWVSYDITFEKPAVVVDDGAYVARVAIAKQEACDEDSPLGNTAALHVTGFGTVSVVSPEDSTSVVSFDGPPGIYNVSIYASLSSDFSTDSYSDNIIPAPLSAVYSYYSNALEEWTEAYDMTGQAHACQYFQKLDDYTGSIVYSCAATAPYVADVIIYRTDMPVTIAGPPLSRGAP